ncbi:hypothetical protein [Bosea sp. F3-2]|uniref:hypothetical protein n=1 Tax=Bosea sp. F3-2 TaxID=2599640 RepID=UPI0024A6D181|nr:hypothetical protein [Bosea sp. F3-2]
MLEELVCLGLIEVHSETLFDTKLGEVKVNGWLDSVASQAVLNAFQCATIDGYDRPTRGRDAHQRGNIASDARDTGHFGQIGAIHANSKMVGELSGA